MSLFERGLAGLPAYGALCTGVKAGHFPIQLTGLGHIHKAMFTQLIRRTADRPVILVTADEGEATRFCEDLCALGERAVLLPVRDLTLHKVESVSREYEQQRLGVLAKMAAGSFDVVVACVDAVMQYTVPPETLQRRTLHFVTGMDVDSAKLPAMLTAAGYERCELTEGPGQFSCRGGIIDVYAANLDAPIRIELWGDTVDTISEFDVLTQRRTNQLDQVSIPPAVEIMYDDAEELAARLDALADSLSGKHAAVQQSKLKADADCLRGGGSIGSAERYVSLIYDEPCTALDYVPKALLMVSEQVKVLERVTATEWQRNQDIEALLEDGTLCRGITEFSLSTDDWKRVVESGDTVLMDTFAHSTDIPLRSMHAINARRLSVWSGNTELLIEDLQDLLHRRMAVVVMAGAEEKNAKTLAEDLAAKGIPALYATSPERPIKGQVLVVRGGLSAGAEFPDGGFAVITHGQVSSARRKSRRYAKQQGDKIHSISELQRGDYVVHAIHGIGIYDGIQQMTVQGAIKDYIKIKYDKNDVLYVPVTQLDMVSKYVGAKEDAHVKIHRLGGQEWQKSKSRVRAAVKDIAKQLIALYSKRMNTPGYAFPADEEWQYDFERKFPFEETEDQLRCVDEIKADMERGVPMDRLLCGDVGFGKTEVALRAAFKCVADGKQCVLLVPTTILALQHYNTIVERFDGFPVTVEMLSRFRTPKQQEAILKKAARGEIDILVGTHRMLSSDVKFRDIGLFIVDEEQRFGVAQKERIKEIAPNVDTLTLSATPIPRTLNMAMSGIRDMSVIEEAPMDRRPVQTYVMEHDNMLLVEAIKRELRRDGQVYYLHNRVENIEQCAAGLQMRIPEARIGVAHGKMTQDQLSDVWQQMLDHEIDVLVCTTIIETGIDISNANTLIIENADRFGLSQLHQLRGRVGRSSRRAFAYLTFVRGKALSDISTKRLEAMREFTEFGAGFKIAMRDMEIRGAGNLLGAQQHGHMESVGYDMYLKLLAEAVDEEKGVKPKKPDAECLIDLPISAHIPEEYISGSMQRLEIYRRIADIRTMEDSLDVYDELIDRFGEPPVAIQGLIDIALLRNMAASAGITEVKQQQDTVLLFPKRLDLELGKKLTSALIGRVMINAGARPYYAVKVKKGLTSLDTLREALEAMNADEVDA